MHKTIKIVESVILYQHRELQQSGKQKKNEQKLWVKAYVTPCRVIQALEHDCRLSFETGATVWTSVSVH